MQCAVINCENQAIHTELCKGHLHYIKGRAGRLGFNLIVKNESKHLEKCLLSIRDIADEIVITDTGSDDNTVEIALKYADKVLFHEWQNSFSEARNFGLQYSTTDWICWIDADETLMPESLIELRNIMFNDKGAAVLFCPLLSELPDGRASKHYLPKFFKRNTAHFESIVHNQLIHGEPAMNTNITFWHTGYNLPIETMKKKRERTITLLRKQLEENPEDAFATMNLARTLLTSGKYDESLKIAEKGLKLKDAVDSCRQMLLYNVAICAVNLQNFDKGIEACWETLKINPDNIDMTFILGWIHCLKNEYEKAVVYFNRYFQLREAQANSGFNLLILDFWDAQAHVYGFLGEAYRLMPHHDKAIDSLTQSIFHQADDIQRWKNLCVAYQNAQKPDMVERTLWSMIERGLTDLEVFGELRKM